MNEGASEVPHPEVDVRPTTGLVRSSLDEIKAIQTLLADVYRDAGDGRTLFRELVQNADDAGASWLKFVILESGWSDARNGLLRGPALLVANDGAFPDNDRKALHKAIGGSKEDEVGKIGTFGIGLKSVFHICEAFLYMGAEKTEWRGGVLNPWAGTGDNGHADPLNPDWDEIDVDRIRSVTTELLGNTGNGLLLWIPLRCPEHLNRGAEGRHYGLGERCPKPEDLFAWFGCAAPAALVLAQCGHLQTVRTERAAGPESLRDRVKLAYVHRQQSGWVGRYQYDEESHPDRTFKGEICSGDRSWSAIGIEARGSETLRQLQSRSDWPQSPKWENGRYSSVPRKALAHAAITVLRPIDREDDLPGSRLRWAVFLPLDDDPEPRSSAIVESKGPSPAWEIILHGYFWPSQDRRSIPGVTEELKNSTGDEGMRIAWNRTLCEELVLPLLPSALANAVDGVDDRVARKLLKAVASSSMMESRLAWVIRRHWLLPTVMADGVRWKSLDANAYMVLSIPNWILAPRAVRGRFAATCGECAGNVVFIDHDAPRFAGELDDWTDDHLERLLNCISGDVFGSPQSLLWIKGIVGHVLGPDACGEDTRAAVVARWLVRQVGDGALAHTTRRSFSRESRDELRKVWRSLCDALPKAWLVDTPVGSQQAVAELAAQGVLGEGLFPAPFERPQDLPPPEPQLDPERLDYALRVLGRWLKAGSESERLRHSRLLLAETLLSVRHERPLGEQLVGLPLLRATKLPEDREEAWSIAELRRRIESCRVFARPDSEVSDRDGTDGIQPKRLSDPKQAVTELAEALDEAIWLVSGEAVALVAPDVPSPRPEALANAVLQAEAFADPTRRKPLLMRLAPAVRNHTSVCWAVRSLLAGRVAGVVEEDVKLLHDRTETRGALRILLRLLNRSWCAVQGTLVESLSHDVLEFLSVGQADDQALHRLLGECLDKSVAWSGLSDIEVRQLLQDLYGATHEERERWRAMPLHRGVDGTREALDERARRSTGSTGELQLPPELESEVRLLDPDSQAAHLYDSVPKLDSNGVLRLMLEDARPWRFAERIVHSVRPSEGPALLPQDG